MAGFVHLASAHGEGTAELQRVFDSLLAEPGYRPGLGFLWDRRSLPAPSRAWVHHIARFLTITDAIKHTRWAVVVSDASNYGMARMLALLVDPLVHIGVFEDVDEAGIWLRAERAD